MKKQHLLVITARASTRAKAANKVRDLVERQMEEGGGYIDGINPDDTLRKEFVAMEWIEPNGWTGYEQLRTLRGDVQPVTTHDGPMITAANHFEQVDLYRNALVETQRMLEVAQRQRDAIVEAFQLVWKHLKGERIRHDYITGTEQAGDLKTLQQVCEEALATVKGGTE